MKRLLLILAFAATLAAVPAARAQVPSTLDRSPYTAASYFRYGETGEVTIVVNVWGTVRNPGLYEVPRGTRLSTLFSLAGGPAVTPRNRREHRTIHARLARPSAQGQQVIFETTMEDAIFAAADDPVLEPGDVLTVDTVTRQPFYWRDALPIVSAVASVGIAIGYFVR